MGPKLALRSSQGCGDRDRPELALLATEIGMRERSPERSVDQRREQLGVRFVELCE
jgi:hypothetical protein